MALTANQDWLYKQMSGMNVDLGSEEQFAQAMQDENNRQWVYDQAGKMGIDLGMPEQFSSAMLSGQSQPTNPSVKTNPAPTTEAQYQANLQQQDAAQGNAPAAPIVYNMNGGTGHGNLFTQQRAEIIFSPEMVTNDTASVFGTPKEGFERHERTKEFLNGRDISAVSREEMEAIRSIVRTEEENARRAARGQEPVANPYASILNGTEGQDLVYRMMAIQQSNKERPGLEGEDRGRDINRRYKALAHLPEHEAQWAEDEKILEGEISSAKRRGGDAMLNIAKNPPLNPAGYTGGIPMMQIRAYNEQTDPNKISEETIKEIISRYDTRIENETKQRLRESITEELGETSISDQELSSMVDEAYNALKRQAEQQVKTQSKIDDSDIAVYLDYVQQQMQDRFIDASTPQSDVEYFVRKVVEGNIIGQLAQLYTSTPAQRAYDVQGLQKYESQLGGWKAFGLNTGASLTGIVLDPLMWVAPEVGGVAGRTAVRAIGGRVIGKMGYAGAEELAARAMVQKGLLNTAQRYASSAATFAMIDAGHDVFNQLYYPTFNPETGQYENASWNPLQTLGAMGKGAATGTLFAGAGILGDKAQVAVGKLWNESAGVVACRATHFTLGTNAMVGTSVASQLLQGKSIDEINWGGEYADAAAMQLFFDIKGGAEGLMRTYSEYAKAGQKLTIPETFRANWEQMKRGAYANTFTQEEIEQFNKAGFKGSNAYQLLLNLNGGKAFESLQDLYVALDKVANDPTIDTQAKYKLASLIYGKVDANLKPIQVDAYKDEQGRYVVRTYDNAGQNYETKYFTNEAKANEYRQQQYDITRNNLREWQEDVVRNYQFAQDLQDVADKAIIEIQKQYPQYSKEQLYGIMRESLLNPHVGRGNAISQNAEADAIRGMFEEYLTNNTSSFFDALKAVREQAADDSGIKESELNDILSQDYKDLDFKKRSIYDNYLRRLAEAMPNPASESTRIAGELEAGGPDDYFANPQQPQAPVESIQPTREDVIRQEVVAEVTPNTHKNGYVYPVKQPGENGKAGYIVNGDVTADVSDPEHPIIANNDVVTVRWEDGTVEQLAAKDLDLISTPEPADNIVATLTEQRLAAEAQQAEAEQVAQNLPEGVVEFTNGNETMAVVDNGDGTYQLLNSDGTPDANSISAEQLADNGYAMIPREQVAEQPAATQEPQQPAAPAPVIPNIETMSAEELGASAVEYMGDKASATAYLEAERDKADADVKRTAKLKVGRFDGIEDFKRQNDQIQAAKRAAIDRYNKLQNAITAANAYKTVAEQQEEAERKAREAAMREQRRQLAEAEAAGDIEAKWQNTKKTVGFAATKTLPNGQKVNGHYILTEAGDVVPSHDPRKNYADSEGYLMENGQNVNDNNYKDPEVQKIANDIAQNYGGQAVEQMPFLENKAGRVLSGNNRTISGIIAAENNTDQAYLAALAENAQQYGFTPEQLAEYQHPRLQFVVEDELPFTTGTFAMFNQQEKKTKSSVNRAIANSKMVTEAVRDRLLEIMDQYESLDSFFASPNAASSITQTLIIEGLMTKQEVAEKMEDNGTFNQTGKEYVTDMLLGTLFDEQTIRMLGIEKALKQSILRALPSIVENRRLKGYELTESINEAIKYLYEARNANKSKDGKKISISDAFQLYLRQGSLTDGYTKDRYKPFDIILANRMSAGVEQLREILGIYNQSARDEANGQEGLFEPRTVEQIKQDVYEYYTKQQPDLAAALNGAAEEGAQSQSPVSSGTANAGEVRPTQREQLTEYLNGIADEEHKPILFDNSTLVEILRNIGATPDAIAEAQSLVVNGGHIEGFYLNGYVCLNIDNLPDAERARTKYVHERQHDLTRKDIKRVKEVMNVASESELKSLLEKFSNSPFYNKKTHSIVADEFISFAMEEAYKAKDDAELESALRAFGVKDELIDIIKSINNEQRGIEAFAMARRNAPNNHSAESSSRESRADSGAQSGGGLGREGSDADQQSLRRTEGGGDGVPAAGEVTDKIVPERPNSKQLQGMSYNVAEAEDYIGRVVRNILDENGYNNVEIVGIKVIGSRVNGNAREDSDLDAIVEFKGDAREDSLFNLFAGENIELDGVKVDVNPITEGKSGTIEQFMRRSDEYLAEKNAETEIKKAIADFKKQYPDPNVAIFFRNGKTYDIYGEDAVKAAEILGIEPTEKDGMPFVSFPTEDVGTNLRKFIANGVKVGIASHPAYKPSKGDYQQGDKFMLEGKEAIIKGFTHFGTAIVEVDGSRRELSREQLDDILDYGDYMYHVGDVVTYNGKRAQIVEFASGEPVIEVEGESERRYVSFSDIERVKKETPTEDNAHLSDNKSAFVAPQMPIDTQTNAQKQSKAPSEDEQQQAAQYLNEALQEVISKSGDKLPQNITIDENTIEDNPDSVEMTARLLIDGKPSDFSVTIFDQSLGARGGFDPVNMVKFYPREELDKWDWDLADRLAEEFNKTRTQESGLATVMDESDAVYFFNMQAALDFAEKARQEIAPTNDPRFAISGTQVIPVTDKTLVGLHNISAEKLRKALKMGGLANPSTAVIDIARQNHEQYGDISLIMPSAMVDSYTGRNAGTFTGDIWSPTYPSITKQMSDKGDENYYQTITKLFANNDARQPILSRIKLDFDDYLDRDNVRAGLTYWYLLEKGIEPTDIYYNSGVPEEVKERFKPLAGYLSNLNKEEIDQLIAIIADEKGTTVEQMKQDAQEAVKRYRETIDNPDEKPFRKNIAQKAIDEIEYYGIPYGILSNEFHRLNNAVQRDGTIDLDATLIAAQDLVQSQYQADFDKWLADMDKRFDIKEVIFTGYNNEGDRKYIPHTLANASKMMNAERLQNAGSNGGLGATRGQLVEKMLSLAEIRANKNRLRPGEEEDHETEEWNKLGDEWFEKILGPLSDMQKISDNPFSNTGYAEQRLQEALFKADPVAYLNKEYGYKIDPKGEWAKNLKDLVQRIKSLPTKYFETKFRRPVYLNEFANAVVPNDLPTELRDGLEKAGLTLFEYDPKEEGARRAATLQATDGEGIRFSVSGGLDTDRTLTKAAREEMQQIKDAALADGTFMKAPNGKLSNLNERQWLQVRTRAFQRMFGDWENDPENATKVLDENGEPMVAKHGTPFTFTTFDKSKQQQNDAGWLGRGFYFFTKNDDYAAGYARGGQVINAFLNIREPYYATYADMERLAEMDSKEESERFTQGLIDEGYDGVYFDANLNGEWVAFEPNQIKSATDNNGDFSEENDDIRFSISNQNNDIFYSNAERAVEGIKQEKATPEQWRAMIEKAGGLKAGEDKWIGLSDWLAQQRPTVTPQANETRSQFVERAAAENKRFTLSKQDLLDYIREHKIQIEEQEYGEYEEDALFLERKDEFKRYYDEAVEAGEEDPNEVAWDRMIEEYGDDFSMGYYAVGDELMRDNDSDYAQWEADSEGRPRNINETRLRYTTWGLENKREIALIVPDIEEWNEYDEIHFGDAGPGKAIAWVRFGDAHKIKYGENGEELADVLVIDEIQSKRHQSGREQGYQEHIDRPGLHIEEYIPSSQNPNIAFARVTDENGILYGQVQRLSDGKYRPHGSNLQPIGWTDYNTEEEAFNIVKKEAETLNEGGVPDAPFEKKWHELAMKRILRFAAENGYDKVAWTTGEQQAKRYDIGKEIDHIVKTDENTYEVYPTSGLMMTLEFDENGMYADEYDREYNGKSMSDIFGKDLAKRLKEMPVDETLQGDGLRVGYDGMKGFYDDILPRFMQKYGKKWGVQVGEVTMPQLEDGYQTMHSVDITDDMRRSVLEGQPMFSISGRRPTGTIAVQPNETRRQYAARVGETIKNMTPRNTSLDDAIRFSITVNHNSPYLLKKADGSFVDPETGERLGFDHRFMGKGEGGQAHGWGTYLSVRDLRDYASQSLMNGGIGQYFDVEKIDAIDPHGRTRAVEAIENYLRTGIPIDQHLEYEIASYQQAVDKHKAEGRNSTADEVAKYIKEFEAALAGFKGAQRHHYSVEIPDNDGENYLDEQKMYSGKEFREIADRIVPILRKRYGKDSEQAEGFDSWADFQNGAKFQTMGRDIYQRLARYIEDKTNFRIEDETWKAASDILREAGFTGIHYDGRRDGECYVIFNEDDAKIVDHIRFSVTGGENTDALQSTKRSASIDPTKRYNDFDNKIRSDNFKAWFGDWQNDPEHASKVVDADGKPLVVYHGTKGKFYTFERKGGKRNLGIFGEYNADSKGFFFTPNEKDAALYGQNVMPVYLNVRKPLFDKSVDVESEEGKQLVEDIWYIFKPLLDADLIYDSYYGVAPQWMKDEFEKDHIAFARRLGLSWEGHDFDHSELATWEYIDTDEFQECINRMRERGYDGMRVYEDEGYSWFVLDPNQIKSATENNGEFSKDNNDIRFSVNNPSTLSRSETVTKALVQQANNNYNIMQSALKKVTADLKGIRAAMRMQSDYDRKVVDALLNLYNTLLQENGVWAQYMPDTTRRIATQIVHAIGKQNITEEVNTIMDHMVHAQAKAAQRQWDKLRQTPIDKINISGVVMQGKVALEGQHALKAMNDALQANMTIEQIEEQINQLMDMEDNATDESLKTQYKGQWIGLTIAAQHLERLQHLQEERQQLDLELQSARSNKALKPAARQQLVENIKQAMRDNYIEQAEAYTRSTQDLSEYVNTQEGRAKDFIRRQDANRDKIRSYAQRDLEGLATNPNRNRTRGNVARSIWDAFASPIRDLQSLLRLTGLHAPDGEGYLYNHFMRNWMDGADMERTGIVAASKTLDEKIAELTHGKYKTWEEAARKINDASHNKFSVMSSNGVDGKDQPVIEEIPLNAGNALYIYAVNKQIDGKMKLSSHNITDEDVKALTDKVREQFGQEILDVVDWVQSEYFSQLRNRYNPTHEALFGAPMDAIENYFPLRLNPLERQQNEDLSEPDTDAARLLAGTSTGSIKRRKRNSIGIDIRNADFFQEVIRHISQMERWNAFAQWNRDANILFSDINFRNRIKGMKGTIYGEGDKLYNYMKDAFRVAIGTYKPNADGFSKEILNAAKGVTSAKINFRVFTALKQIASFPAFFTYMQDGTFVTSYLRNWLTPHSTMKWAKENLPNFEKRVSKRDLGDMRLMSRSTDWQWNKRILEWSSKYGMFFNVFFDTLTCATGARAVYDSHLADYLKKGYGEEDARNRARQDAEQAFNTSQQSSEGAFMAPIQMDRNAVTAALTVFRTSPMQYTRNFFFHVRGLLRKIGEGKRDEQIAFRMGQYKNDGLSDEQARKAAEKDYNKSIRADVTGVVVYGALLGILWRLVGSFPYLFFGDDDDKKKQIVMDAVTGGAFVQPITGLIGGSYIESALDGNGLISSMFAPELPFTQDAKRAEQYLQNNKYAEFASQALSVLMQSGTGFDPLTASDMVSRIVTTLDSEEELEAATQALRVSQALLSIPQSQYEQMLIDKVVSGETDEDAALEDYIRYQKIHTAPLTWFMRGEESDEKAEENAEKRFNKLLTERDKIKNPEDYEE